MEKKYPWKKYPWEKKTSQDIHGKNTKIPMAKIYSWKKNTHVEWKGSNQDTENIFLLTLIIHGALLLDPEYGDAYQYYNQKIDNIFSCKPHFLGISQHLLLEFIQINFNSLNHWKRITVGSYLSARFAIIELNY